jgi:glycosyltransferase involved in cell wall biosynthesis
MKKVLFILNDLRGGGAERVFVNIANGFHQLNIPVAFLVGEKEGVYLNLLHPEIPISETGSTTFYSYLKSFPAIFKKQEYTHIFTASDYASAAAILTKKLIGISAKIMVTHHYNLPANRTFKHWKGDLVAKLIHRFLFPDADKIICVSKGCLAWLRKHSNNKLSQAIPIYNPVFDDSINTPASEKVIYPIDTNGKIILLNAGRLEEQKDQLTLLKAFTILKKSNPAFVLFILGDGPLKQQLETYISGHHLHNDVFLMGFDTNPYKWMTGCHFFVSSSISEGFGNVLVEAMALGKTIVSTNCPSGPAEILQNGALGYLCPVQDPPALATTILKAVNSPLDAAVLTAASQQYTIEAIVKQYIEIL